MKVSSFDSAHIWSFHLNGCVDLYKTFTGVLLFAGGKTTCSGLNLNTCRFRMTWL